MITLAFERSGLKKIDLFISRYGVPGSRSSSLTKAPISVPFAYTVPSSTWNVPISSNTISIFLIFSSPSDFRASMVSDFPAPESPMRQIPLLLPFLRVMLTNAP